MDNSKYFLGLDIGTNSVGWAVTDENYNILNFNGKKMWGIRLFEKGNPADKRRANRAARRSRQRKIERSRLLRELFAEEVSKIDPNFFIRLRESDLYYEDKSIDSKGSLFNDDEWTDKKYHKTYPTIFHLIMDLINNDEKKDIRLVFLACNWLIKNRGHFIFEGQDLDVNESFEHLFVSLKNILSEENYEIELNFDFNEAVSILSNSNFGISKKKENLKPLFGKSKLESGIITLISGGKQDLSTMFENEEYKESDYNSLSFSGSKFDDFKDEYLDLLGDNFDLINKLKEIYDASILEKMMSLSTLSPDGKKYISSSKIASYEKHAQDLKLLKSFIKKYIPSKYSEIFRSKSTKSNYVSYVKSSISSSERVKADKFTNKDDFYKYLKGIVSLAEDVNKDNDADFKDKAEFIKSEMDKGNFLPKQRTGDNSVIPYQLKEIELKKILDNQSKYYDFLNKEEDGLTVKEKIISLLTFRIPYYVGPLNPSHNSSKGNSWVVRKESGKVTPWNFEDKIDIEKSRELFIDTKLNTCSYVKDEIVLPKNSLLYREYMVLNELNNLKINGELVDDDLKKKIYEELFKNYKKVTQKRTIEFIKKVKNTTEDIVLTGIDGDFKQNLASYIDIKKIIGDKIERDKYKIASENIIKDISLYGDDKKYLEAKIKRDYKDIFTDEEIKKLKNLRYSDWGRLSKKLLNGITFINTKTGETDTVIGFMRNYSLNLMELMSKAFTLTDEIEKINKAFIIDEKFSYSMLDDLYLSPSVKRMLWQSLQVVEEIKSIKKNDPAKIFVEMARGSDGSGRKDSRKKALLEFYKANKKDIINEIGKDDYDYKLKNIEERNDADFRWDNLYLYYTQLGKCMYSLEDIDLDDLKSQNIYDQDHIYPKSKLYDDSIENRVLVKKDLNLKKGNNYPIDNSVIADSLRPKIERFWKILHDKKLIGDKKYSRLIRKTAFTDDELAGFIERQMVETRQATKETANLLKRTCQDSEVVYVKAGNVSIFRQKFDIVKSRAVNDYHHAHDAYLNIVVGNIYDTKFTKDPRNFIKKDKSARYYNLEKLFEYDVERNGYIAWKANDEETGKPGSIANVKKNINNRNILFTRMSYEGKGALFDVNLMRKGSGQISQKENSPKADINKYGGYNKASTVYFCAIKYEKDGKEFYSIETVPLYLKEKVSADKNMLVKYFEESLNAKNVSILVNKIKLNSLIKVDGFYYHLTGRTNDRLAVSGAVQLTLDLNSMKYIKKLEKFINRYAENKNTVINKYELLSKEENERLYEILSEKLENTIYKNKKNNQSEKISSGFELFKKLDVKDQILQLNQLLLIFGSQNNGVNTELIGGKKKTGVVFLSNKFKDFKEFKLINQSITGLFENEVDLLKL
ncbi:type II CRISPR RNA-guided endonuclease Cas9 [uncultured Parvimonas sp.]|uniref:type II CRISPR RNA-guided endonuclease Cas9 n=1 Tax=uncultured Parvimonas sp. TaxID=747372 RepID=UPI00288BED1D|nr:type II CRISPR RNA-guided endonuclease Cas9 [uncultured Parvimonas sp.]